MLDKQKSVADCSAQELVAALMLQSIGDALDSEQVLHDLYDNPHLWKSFWMGPLLPLDDGPAEPLMLLFLRDLAQFWHASTFYILAKDKFCVKALEELGFQWHCDTIRVISGRQAGRLLGDFNNECFVLVYWWD